MDRSEPVSHWDRRAIGVLGLIHGIDPEGLAKTELRF